MSTIKGANHNHNNGDSANHEMTKQQEVLFTIVGISFFVISIYAIYRMLRSAHSVTEKKLAPLFEWWNNSYDDYDSDSDSEEEEEEEEKAPKRSQKKKRGRKRR